MRSDANKIGLRVVRNILAGARPFELEVAGTRVTCGVSSGTTRPWPRIDRLSVEDDGPEWPTRVVVDCGWPGGTCKLEVEASYASGAKYRHDIALRVDLAEPRNQLVWTNIAKAIDKAGDDDRAAVDIRFFTTKPRAPGKDDRGQQVNEAMREVLTESGLPRVRGSTARLCEVRLPTAEIDPSAEMAFRQLIHLALLKLDFVARKRAHERGVPLIDLQARWSIAPDAVAEVDEEEEDDDDDDDDGTPDDTLGVQHWAGGFNEAARLEAFVSENFWEIGWSRESAKPAARRTWQRFAAIRVGDRFAIKGLGGTHDLAIRYVGRVVAVDSERGRVELQRDPVQLFRGKGPRGAGAGNWHDTLVPITRADIIAAIFGGTPAIDTSTANAAKPSNLADVPLNLILYGPPGTGKTYRLTSSLIPHFRGKADRDARGDTLMALADELRWGRAVAVAMHALGGEASVADLANHPLLQVKYAAQPLKTTLTSRITSVLANHTVGDSTTVVSARRVGEAFFDKRPDTASTWFLASALSDELIDASSQVTAPARPEEANNYTFLTFHQAYGYEDFIEGIRPIMAAADPDEGGALAYSLEPGAFMKAAQAAVRLAGFSGTLHELCSLPRERRRQLFDGAAGYAVFIDEINRGNVSRIFGELITLLEPDKRLGAENEIIVSLPYSKRRFGVPPNIHVIGTMNTADRSVEALDTALRRRFEFEELVPDLEQLDFEIDNEIEVDKMLRAINHRIEKLYDRDHCIGHAYLLPLKEEPTLEALKLVFKHRIIPLLQEYFFGDC